MQRLILVGACGHAKVVLGLARAAGFDVVGVQRRHGRLDGEWRDCVVVEKLIGEAAA